MASLQVIVVLLSLLLLSLAKDKFTQHQRIIHYPRFHSYNIFQSELGDTAEAAGGCNEIRQKRGITTGRRRFYIKYDAIIVNLALCDFDVFPGRGSVMAYKVSAGTPDNGDQNYNGLFVIKNSKEGWFTDYNNYGTGELHVLKATSNYVSRSRDSGYWSLVRQASVRAYTAGEQKVFMDFKTINTPFNNWFTQSNLIASTWGLISLGGGSYFTIDCPDTVYRYFYISSLWGGCPGDYGYFALLTNGAPGDVCTPDYFPSSSSVPVGNLIAYSPSPSTSNIIQMAYADTMVVWLDMDDIDSGPGFSVEKLAASCAAVAVDTNNRGKGTYYIQIDPSTVIQVFCGNSILAGSALVFKYDSSVTGPSSYPI